MATMLDKLDPVIERYREIEESMGDPEVAANFDQIQALARERASLENLVNIVETRATRIKRAKKPATIGVGIPGTISPVTGLVKNANSTWLIGHQLDQDLTEIFKRPIKVANDANCFAMSEAIDGAAIGHQTVFAVILGTGVGLSLIHI